MTATYFTPNLTLAVENLITLKQYDIIRKMILLYSCFPLPAENVIFSQLLDKHFIVCRHDTLSNGIATLQFILPEWIDSKKEAIIRRHFHHPNLRQVCQKKSPIAKSPHKFEHLLVKQDNLHPATLPFSCGTKFTSTSLVFGMLLSTNRKCVLMLSHASTLSQI